ncbi:hypothetical protein [Actinophytocola sp.]|uniref:hypothetical protein n=1 Tax=Actinophytocola sp. TaxID=1872138 RepID=UPI003D6B3011
MLLLRRSGLTVAASRFRLGQCQEASLAFEDGLFVFFTRVRTWPGDGERGEHSARG